LSGAFRSIVIHGSRYHMRYGSTRQPSQRWLVAGVTPSLGRKKAMSQDYQPGRLVRLARVGFSKFDASANDLYEVMRLMPVDQTGEVTYRIKSVIAGERSVRKAEITAYVSPE
jgi:hypothetical protein